MSNLRPHAKSEQQVGHVSSKPFRHRRIADSGVSRPRDPGCAIGGEQTIEKSRQAVPWEAMDGVWHALVMRAVAPDAVPAKHPSDRVLTSAGVSGGEPVGAYQPGFTG